MSTPPTAEPGWYRDPEMPGTRRYWNGETWTDHVAPEQPQRETPSAGRGIIIVAVGILAAIAAVWIIVQLSKPSSMDCATQRVEVADGTRAAVDPSCT